MKAGTVEVENQETKLLEVGHAINISFGLGTLIRFGILLVGLAGLVLATSSIFLL